MHRRTSTTESKSNSTDRAAVLPESRKLGVVKLAGIVVASMIGGGAFNLPQNMARGAGLAAVAIAWIITLIGMFFLSNSFRLLADRRPDLTAGIYSYARAGFGPFVGFQMAWGYWLSAAFGNVAFAVLIMQILSYFFPVFGNGQNWPSLVGGSILIWGMSFIVMSGVKRTAALAVAASILNVTTIGFVLVVMAFFVSGGRFAFDIWGQQGDLGSVFTQVKSTMLVTLWVFIGIEAAAVISGRARKMSDVGPATLAGLGVSTLLYSLLSLLPFGIMHRGAIAKLPNPSAAYVLASVVGDWGAAFVNVSLLLAVLSSWLAWTILVAELPFEGAKGGVFPEFLAKENRFHAPAPSLWVSSVVMQMTLFVVPYAHDAWLWLIDITGVMILPSYFASALFLALDASRPGHVAARSEGRQAALTTGVLASVYALWLLYAAGLEFVLMSTIVFALGVPVFWWARRESSPGAAVFTDNEKSAVVLLLVVAVIAATLFLRGVLKVT